MSKNQPSLVPKTVVRKPKYTENQCIISSFSPDILIKGDIVERILYSSLNKDILYHKYDITVTDIYGLDVTAQLIFEG